jgi:hypothetical protein
MLVPNVVVEAVYTLVTATAPEASYLGIGLTRRSALRQSGQFHRTRRTHRLKRSEFAWRPRRVRWALAIAVVVVAAAAAAFFTLRGNGNPSNTAPVRAVARYDEAVAAGDASRACRLLAPEAQAAIATAARAFGAYTCERILSVAFAHLSIHAKQQIRAAQINVVSQDPNRVRVVVSFADGKKGSELWVLHLGNRWLVGLPVQGTST